MSDRYSGMSNVVFDFQAAETLASVAASSATSVRNLQSERTQRAQTAALEFRGYFAQLFTDNVATGTTDAGNLATCLDRIATYTRDLITAAEEENVRRQHAREWAERQKAREENLLVDIYYNLAFWESKDPQPYVQHDPPAYSAGDISLARQELPTRGGGGGGGTSSADPSTLRIFGLPSAWYSAFESSGPQTLRTAWNNFVAGCQWGTLDAQSSVDALDQWIAANIDERAWANAVAAAFEAAGSDGGTASVSDASLLEALAQAGLDPVRGAVSLTPPELYGVNPTTGYSNDPVNTVTGNFIEPETDLSFAGAASTLQLTRMYNSQSPTQGLFGPGWVSVLETRVIFETGGNPTFVMADGRQVRFPQAPAALTGADAPVRAETDNFWIESCEASEAGASAAASLPTGSAILVRNNQGSWWSFAADGNWLGSSSGPGTGVTVRRNAEGLVTGLGHERGHAITIEHAGERVVAAASSDGRRITYEYDADGRLIEAHDAVGTRSYRWNEAGLISAVISADGVVEAENTYDDEGRVISQLTEFGREVRFAYLPGRVTSVSDTDGTSSNTWVADRRGRLTGIIDGNGERISMSYDQHGNRTSVIDRDGSRTESTYDDRGRVTLTRLPDGGEISTSYDEFDRTVTVVTSTGGVIEYEYDSDLERNPSRIVDAAGGGTTLSWDRGLLMEVVDPTGVRLEMSYDSFGELIATTNAAGDVARLERDDAGRILAAVSPSGHRTEYRYDAATGLLIERRDADGAKWRFVHGSAGKLAAVIDPLDGRTEFEYGAHGKLVRTVDPLGREVSREFDVMGNVSSMHLPDGAAWVYEHDALSRVRGLTDPAGNRWSAEYDELGQLREQTSPAGVTSRVTRSHTNNSVTAKARGLQTTVVFDEFDRPKTTVADDGSEQVIAYDLSGRPVEVVDAEGGLTTIDYDLGGRITKVVSPAGHHSWYSYDSCGRLASSIDATGAETRYEYNPESLVAAVISANGDIARCEYDAMGRIIRREVPGEGVSRFSYDAMGRVVFTQDARFGQRRFSYDAAGQLATTANGLGGITRFAYDQSGQLVSTTDPLGGVTRRAYDKLGRLISSTDPLGRSTSATYDSDGRQLTQTDPAGQVTEWQYDDQGTLEATLVNGVELAHMSRDARGRVLTVRDSTQGGLPVTHTLRYDRLGRLIERSRGEHAMRWEYDADGLRSAMITPNGVRTEYEHDGAGKLIAVRHPVLGEARYEYDAFGRLIAARAGDTQQTWEYDRGFTVKHSLLDAHGVSSSVITRDEDGRVLRIQSGERTVEYGYDDACQLVSTTEDGHTTRWQFDLAGRLVAESKGDAAREFVYDAAGQLLAEQGPDGLRREYAYDRAGRRVSEQQGSTRTSFGWNSRGWLESVTRITSTDEQSVSMWVDALGELAQVAGVPVWWDSASGFPALTSIGETTTLAGPAATGIAGHPLAADPQGGQGAAAPNLDGATPNDLNSSDGGSTDWLAAGWRPARSTAPSDPWGATSAAAQLVGEVSITATGGVVIAGLEWMGARVYDPAARGFLSVDPLDPVIGAGWAGNPYSFAGNDPLHALDPLGLRPVTDAELRTYAASRQGALASATSAVGEWWNENWEYVAAGAMIVGGVALMFTGVGGPAGIALMAGSGALLAGGISTVSQKSQNGTVDWGRVGTDALIGGVMGAAGGAGGAAVRSVTGGTASATRSLIVNASVNGGIGGIGGGVGYLSQNNWQIQNGWEFAGSIAGGGVAGTVGGIGGPAAGTLANRLGHTSTGWQAQAISAGFTGIGTAGGSVTSDIVSGNEVNWGNAAWSGALGTGTSGIMGAATSQLPIGMQGTGTLGQMPYFHPRSVEGAFNMSQVNTRQLWISAGTGEVAGWGSGAIFGPEGALADGN